MKVKLVAMALAAFISGVLITLGALFLWASDRATSSSPDPVPATAASDDRKMVGAAEHVFFGSVVEELEEVRDEYPWPTVVYHVEVREVLKGSLAEEAIVYQAITDVKERARGGYKLEAGKTYLLATRFNAGEGWHTVSSVNQYIEVTSIEHAQELRERFTSAIEQEIPFDPEYRLRYERTGEARRHCGHR